ncbi:MAG: hypothetical protein FJ242_01625, partial [Nitrospira sp.]|nr:hypothetical protein [Nitrospira sp.]
MAVIFEGKNWFIHKEGITQEGRYIAWSNVKSLYIGGMKGRLNFIYPAGEKWELTIVDFSNNTINIKQSAFLKMRAEKKNEFFETYKFILSQISEQQWSHFQQKLRNN